MKNNQYSIKDLENLTNIKAHTIRIWEQRYGLLEPKRTPTNIRYYEDNDLRKLLNINLLYSNGLKISKIAALTEQEIIDQSRELIQNQSETDSTLDVLVMAIVNLNEDKIQQLLHELFEEKGMERLYGETIIPLLLKVGELWQLKSISVGHEHFFSNIFRAFVLSKTAELSPAAKKDKKALFFLPPEEEHELSLLVYQFLFREAGWEVLYLGACVPFEDLEITYKQSSPDLAVTNFIKQISEKDFDTTMKRLTEIIPESKLVLAGFICQSYRSKLPKKAAMIESGSDLKILFV